MRHVAAIAALLSLLAACSPAAPPRGRPPLPAAPAARADPAGARIRFDCTPSDAVINVDGRSVGTVAEAAARGGLRLSLGLHRFEIVKPGYVPYRIELNLGEQEETIHVELHPATRRR